MLAAPCITNCSDGAGGTPAPAEAGCTCFTFTVATLNVPPAGFVQPFVVHMPPAGTVQPVPDTLSWTALTGLPTGLHVTVQFAVLCGVQDSNRTVPGSCVAQVPSVHARMTRAEKVRLPLGGSTFTWIPFPQLGPAGHPTFEKLLLTITRSTVYSSPTVGAESLGSGTLPPVTVPTVTPRASPPSTGRETRHARKSTGALHTDSLVIFCSIYVRAADSRVSVPFEPDPCTAAVVQLSRDKCRWMRAFPVPCRCAGLKKSWLRIG